MYKLNNGWIDFGKLRCLKRHEYGGLKGPLRYSSQTEQYKHNTTIEEFFFEHKSFEIGMNILWFGT